jgi:hypothetical protein
MTNLDLKRIKLELLKVSAAKAELEFRIEERLEEIERIRGHIKIQEDKEIELQAKIDEANKASQ